MFDDNLELSDVLARLKRADESLAEFIAPLWPGVRLAAAWIEGKPRLLPLADAPSDAGYCLLVIDDDRARVVRPAEEEEIRKYLRFLTKASVILLEDELAYPASSIERLQGIIGPRPLHFAHGDALAPAQARFDGLNLFFDTAGAGGRKSDNPLEALFSGPSIMDEDELFGVPGEEDANAGARKALEALRKHPDLVVEYRLNAVLETAGAVLEHWSRADDGIRLRWRLLDEVHEVTLPGDGAPITSGISLAGARGFDPATLIHLLHGHILDAWR